MLIAAAHRGLDQATTTSSPLYRIPLHDLQWPLPIPEDVMHYLVHSFLWADFTSVRALAASCRCLSVLWRPFSFSVAAIFPTVNGYTSNARKFVQIVQQAPEIIGFIQDLRILNVSSVLSLIPRTQSRSDKIVLEEYCTSLVEICTKTFPSLKRCRLDIQTSWEALPRQIAAALEKLLVTPTLKHLAYFSGGIPLPIMRLHFRNLNSLVFSGYSITNLGQNTVLSSEQAADRLCLTHLYYSDVSLAGSITRDLRMAIDFSTLRSLHIELLQACPISEASASLANLEELTIQLDVYILVPAMSDKLNLEALRSLKCLQVNMDVSMNGGTFLRRIKTIAAILLCSPKSVESMGMKIKERGLIKPDEFNEAWMAFDVELTENVDDKWPDLKKFHITYFDCPDADVKMEATEVCADGIRSRLPVLDRLGILSIEIIRDASLYLSLYHSWD